MTNPKNTPSTEKSPSWLEQILETTKIIVISSILALVIRGFIAEPRYIPSDSMLPTLHQGDRLVVEKVSYHFHSPQSGDIVVFEPPKQLLQVGYEKEQAFIKRVVGTEGDTVEVKEGKVYRNGQSLAENYILESPNYRLPPIKVPQGELFVMGDNRNNSNDSHIWGFLPTQNVIGKAILRFFPFSKIGII